MKMNYLYAGVITMLCGFAVAEPSAPAASTEAERTRIVLCTNPGEAITYTVQCDPGTRTPGEQIGLAPLSTGVEACRVWSNPVCAPIRGYNPNARPNAAVQDSGAGQSAIVIFGVYPLLGARTP